MCTLDFSSTSQKEYVLVKQNSLKIDQSMQKIMGLLEVSYRSNGGNITYWRNLGYISETIS